MEQKQRHGCLTVYLLVGTVFAFVVAFTMFVIPTSLGRLETTLTDAELAQFNQSVDRLPSGIEFVIVGSLASLTFIGFAGLWRWKKWGFWLIAGVTAMYVALSLIFFPASQAPLTVLQSVGSIGIFYGILHIGNDNKGWPQLD